MYKNLRACVQRPATLARLSFVNALHYPEPLKLLEANRNRNRPGQDGGPAGPPYPDRHTELVKRCQQGERRAQYDLYQQYVKAMYNVCFRIVNHEAEAEDVLQEAFIDAFGHINSFRGQSTFGAWLKQIVVNRSINHLRGRRLAFVDIESHRIGEDDGPDLADPEPYDEEGTQLEVERVRQAMERLPEGYRVVLSLYLFEGYDHEEIGNVLNISETTSRTQYLRGKKRLLELMKNE